MTDLTTVGLLGKNIVARSKKLGFSQESMARIEKGIIAPKINHLEDIARTLNCTIPALFEKCPSTPDSKNRVTIIEKMLRPLPDDRNHFLL